MHRIFRKALDTATGVSQFVIAVIIDIRGFSAFSQTRESPDTAMFIKRVYMKLIDSYFDFASFYKSTGDGLLLTIPFDENNLKEMAQKTVASCIACHTEFGHICSNDPMINFKVPEKIGIGIARGTACCLVSGESTIDYSGRLLNLTSRLTNLARPSGIVIDESFGIELLDEDMRGNFQEKDVYLDGIAENKPLKVYFTKEFTTIPKRNTQPIAVKKWCHKEDIRTLKDLEEFGRFEYLLDTEATSSEDVRVKVTHDKVISGRISKKYHVIINFQGFTYGIEAGRPIVWLDWAKLCERLRENEVKDNMAVNIDIAYVEK